MRIAPSKVDHSVRNSASTSAFVTYAEGVTACSPGLQCEASYPGSELRCLFYAESVIANAFPVGNNPFGVA